MQSAQYWIEKLELVEHPVVGYFKKNYCSDGFIRDEASSMHPNKSGCFSIYYLLEHSQKSSFHQAEADATWHFYEGQPLALYLISPTGDFSTVTLGRGNEGFVFQYTIPRGYWVAATVESEHGFSLVGCTIAQALNNEKSDQANEKELSKQFPEHAALIEFLST